MLENPLLHGPQVDSAAESLLHESDSLGDEAVASLIPASGDTGALVLFLDGLYRGAPPLDDVPRAGAAVLRKPPRHATF